MSRPRKSFVIPEPSLSRNAMVADTARQRLRNDLQDGSNVASPRKHRSLTTARAVVVLRTRTADQLLRLH